MFAKKRSGFPTVFFIRRRLYLSISAILGKDAGTFLRCLSQCGVSETWLIFPLEPFIRFARKHAVAERNIIAILHTRETRKNVQCNIDAYL